MHSACAPGPTPMASGRAISAPALLPLARLDTLEPPPSTAPLSAGEAKESAARDRRGVILLAA
jgi:hypothetical protein